MNGLDFRDIRKMLGFTLKEMAHELGISSADTIREYERGKRDISGPISKLMRIYEKYPTIIDMMKGN